MGKSNYLKSAVCERWNGRQPERERECVLEEVLEKSEFGFEEIGNNRLARY